MHETKKLSKANYDYEIQDGILWIEDLNQGGMSVTNDMENVLMEIAAENEIHKLIDLGIMYKDSLGYWDRVKIESGFDPAEPQIKNRFSFLPLGKQITYLDLAFQKLKDQINIENEIKRNAEF